MVDPTPNQNTPHAIAARIRGLLGPTCDGHLMTAARRLAVGEIALRTALDEVAPVLTPEVVAAVVREYGVDPTWLLTGDYDSQTHRMALEADATRDVDAINAMVTARLTPPGGSTSVRPGGRLGA